MIPLRYIEEWKENAPWQDYYQIEQDLIIVRAMVDVDTEKVVLCYKKYMEFSVDKPPTQKQFLANMEEKIVMKEFTDDIHLILKKGVQYDNMMAWELIKKELIEKI